MTTKWVVCTIGKGYLYDGDQPEQRLSSFEPNSVGELIADGKPATVWLIGANEKWDVPRGVKPLSVAKTGDKFKQKICNVCHCLKPTESFAINQRNKHGIVRRPSCEKCRSDIDKRAPRSAQARRMEKQRPKTGDKFRCPICRRRSIVGITAKVVADHDHHSGNIRAYICDSCNTGLGRFKNGENYLQNAIDYISSYETLK